MKDWRNVVLLGASLLAGVGLFEVLVRAAPIDYQLSPNWRYHPVLGWSQVPNGSYDFGLEGRPIHVSFNSLGFRDREHELEKPPGVRRIVVIGDSFCEAVQVNVEETFQQRLEALLNAQGGGPWEVINLGVGDFGTAQEYIALLEYGFAFEPDVVIHQIFPLNDVCNNSVRLDGLCLSRNDRYRPYFVEEEDGRLRQVSAQPVRALLRRHLVTYRVLEYWLFKRMGTFTREPSDETRNRRLASRGFEGTDPLILTFAEADAQPEPVAAGWRVTEKLIERIVDTVRARGIAYVGLVAPFEVVLTPQWPDFARTLPPPPVDPAYPERRLGALFERLGVPSVMLAEDFRPHLDEVLPFLDGHLNVAGHARAAEALCRRFNAAGLAIPDSAAADPCAVTVAEVGASALAGDVSLPFRVDIGDPGARRWMGAGWHWDETTGDETFAWSDSARSVLTVPLPDSGDVRMAFEALPFEYRDSPSQRVTVVLNGTVVREIPLGSGLRRYSVILPAAALAAPVDTLEFRYAWARSPRDIAGGSADARVLAVAWYSVAFTSVTR